jgi:ABC-type multidrug transport system fused ATPase/permease subunit
VLLAVTLSMLLVAGFVIGVVLPRINKAARHAQESAGVMGAASERMFGAFRTVKASGAEQREDDRVRDAAGQAWHAGVRAAVWGALAGITAGLAVRASFVAMHAAVLAPRVARSTSAPWSRSCCTCTS